MSLQNFTQEQIESLLEFSLANFSKIALPVPYDPRVTIMEIVLGKALLEYYRSLLYDGIKIYQDHFGSIDNKITRLKKSAMSSGGCYIVPDDKEIEKASTELHDIFKRFCIKNHPDVNPAAKEMFAEMKYKYDSGNYFDFLDECDINVPGVLYLRWSYLNKELDAIKEKMEVKLAIWKAIGSEEEFDNEIAIEWKKKRKKISDILTLIRKNSGRHK